MRDKIDVEKLKSDAQNSCCKESFIVLERTPIIRIGAGARIGDDDVCLLFIDISLKLCPGKSIFSTVDLEKGVQLAKSLREIGYDISCDEGQINFEKSVYADDMNSEYVHAYGIIDKYGLFNMANRSETETVTA